MTIGWFGDERVDYITYDTKGIWRCYEIKVSKSDFYSKAKKTFVGHYNYYVMPKDLYEQVKHDIPSHIGVYDGTNSIKRAKKQELKVDEQILKDSMIRSLFRYANKLMKCEDDVLIDRMNKRIRRTEKERDEWKNKCQKLKNFVYNKYGRGWHGKME